MSMNHNEVTRYLTYSVCVCVFVCVENIISKVFLWCKFFILGQETVPDVI